MAKATRAGADAVVFDLEDAVAPEAKNEARQLVAVAIAENRVNSKIELVVRVNRTPSGFDSEDIRAVVAPGLDAVSLPKAEDPDHIRDVDTLISELEIRHTMHPGRIALYPLIESALGLWQIESIAKSSQRIRRLGFGATDYLADLSAGEEAAYHARHTLVVASRALEIGPPIDSVHTRIRDDEGLRRAARRARDLGMFGKAVIHPRQIDIVHEAFRPSEEDLAWAASILEAWPYAESEGRAALEVDGQFVDPAVVLRAQRIVYLRQLSES